MKNPTLLEQYKFAKKMYRITMPSISVVWLLAAVIMFILYPKIPWLGIIFLGMASLTIIIYVFVNKYLNKKIAELESKDDSDEK